MAKAKTKAKTKAEGSVIEGVVRHKPCGWVSDGGAFVEGAGCPKCEERIFASDVEEVTEAELVEDKDLATE